MRAVRAAAIAGAMFVFVACGEDTLDTTESPTLIHPDRWVVASAEDDPFDDRPATFQCPDWTYGPENGVFEVRTGECEYSTFSQPTTQDVPEGSKILIRIHHRGLFYETAAQAHVAVATRAQVLWEQNVAIPSPENAITAEPVIDSSIPAGTSLFFHLHNHGSNSWRLLGIEYVSP